MKRRITGVLITSAVMLAAGLCSTAGCGNVNESDLDDQNGASALSGKVVIDGSSTVYPINEAMAVAFPKSFPSVNVTVGVSGTGGGFKRFTKGETDISAASRPIKPQEFDECKKNGVTFVELPVAYDGLTIVVNPKNDWVDRLTVDQLKKIFLSDGAAQTWKDVNPQWPDLVIKIFAPGTDSGTFDYFKEVVAGEAGSMRVDMSTSEDDNFLASGVAGEKGAIGFFGAAYFFENQAKLKAVAIVDPATGKAVMPAPDAIESGRYAPFSRPLFIYVNEDSLRRPEMKKFVEFYLDHAAKTAQSTGYVALPSELYDLANKHFKERLTGTHYVTATGEKRSGSLASVYTTEKLVNSK
jgi:phosphate transport system substrate-binding protein